MRTSIWTHPSSPGRQFTQGEYLDFMRNRRLIRMADARLAKARTRAHDWIKSVREDLLPSSFDELAQIIMENQWALRVLGDKSFVIHELDIRSAETREDFWSCVINWSGAGVNLRDNYKDQEAEQLRRINYRLRIRKRPIGGISEFLGLFGFVHVGGKTGNEIGQISCRAYKKDYPSIDVMEIMSSPSHSRDYVTW